MVQLAVLYADLNLVGLDNVDHLLVLVGRVDLSETMWMVLVSACYRSSDVFEIQAYVESTSPRLFIVFAELSSVAKQRQQ